MGPISSLSQLSEFDLSETQITDLGPLSSLSQLVDLDLSNIKIRRIEPWLLELPRLRWLNLSGNQIGYLPYEIINQKNCFKDLTRWINDLEKGSVFNEEIKIILIGNGRVGKSCVLDRLTGRDYVPNKPTTHAIKLVSFTTELNNADETRSLAKLNFWDFGGQDIYHGTHRIFMQSRALFLLVWAWESETSRLQMAEEIEAGGYLHRNHILPHWLDYIKSLSKESPIIIVQNKIDTNKDKSFPDEYKIEEFQIEALHRVSAERNWGISELEEFVRDAILKMPEWQLKMPATWHAVRLAIREKSQNQTDISKEEFEALCEKHNVQKASRPSLLRYLHNTGVVFHQNDLLFGRIILDQQWVIEAVYSLFDRTDWFWRLLNRGNGQFDQGDLKLYWKEKAGFNIEQTRLALSFMLNAEICYQII